MNTLPGVVNSLPEVVNSLSEVVNSLPEVVNSLPEVVNRLSEVVNSLPEVVNSLPEVVNSLSEVVNCLPEVVNSLSEVVNSLSEVVNRLRVVAAFPELVAALAWTSAFAQRRLRRNHATIGVHGLSGCARRRAPEASPALCVARARGKRVSPICRPRRRPGQRRPIRNRRAIRTAPVAAASAAARPYHH